MPPCHLPLEGWIYLRPCNPEAGVTNLPIGSRQRAMGNDMVDCAQGSILPRLDGNSPRWCFARRVAPEHARPGHLVAHRRWPAHHGYTSLANLGSIFFHRARDALDRLRMARGSRDGVCCAHGWTSGTRRPAYLPGRHRDLLIYYYAYVRCGNWKAACLATGLLLPVASRDFHPAASTLRIHFSAGDFDLPGAIPARALQSSLVSSASVSDLGEHARHLCIWLGGHRGLLSRAAW